MKLPPVTDPTTIRIAFCDAIKAAPFRQHDEVELRWISPERLMLCQVFGEGMGEVRTDVEEDWKQLRALHETDLHYLVLVGRRREDEGVVGYDLHIHYFHRDQPEVVPFAVYLSDEVIDTGIKRAPRYIKESISKQQDARSLLLGDILLPTSLGEKSPRLILGPSENKSEQDAFVIHGDKSRLVVKRGTKHGAAFYECTALSFPGTKRRRRRDYILAKGAIQLLGNIEQCLGKCPGQDPLEHAWDTSDEFYQKTWRYYLELEVDQEIERARGIGAVTFTSWSGDEQITIACQRIPDGLVPGNDRVEFFADPEAYEAYLERLSPASLVDEEPPKADSFGEVLQVDAEHGSMLVKLLGNGNAPPANGVLFCSLGGTRINTQRRHGAYEKIVSGQGSLPELGHLIIGELYPMKPRPIIRGLTPEVQRKIFPDNPPTLQQERAIEMAVNCPDLCLIQGPPGTGKTTVIRAIFERLAQVAGGEVKPGMFLISGYQHDAVENAAARIDVGGLPPIKFGSRGSDGGQDETWRDTIGPWRQKLQESISIDYKLSDWERFAIRMRDVIMRYRFGPPPLAIILEDLRQLLPEARNHLGSSTLIDFERTVQDLLLGDCPPKELRYVRALRASITPWQDDGPERAQAALSVLFERLKDDERQDLQHVLDHCPKTDEDLKPLRLLQGRLLRRWRSISTSHSRLENKAISEVFALIELDLQERELASFDKKQRVAWDFLNRLEDIEDLGETLKRYSSVYAATCQGCVKSGSRGRWGPNALEEARLNAVGSSSGVETVVIDEAARSTPLDLYIPMSEARRRIILVGDHRQLPHLIEENIIAKVESRNEDADERELTKTYLEKSLFQVLWERARVQSGRDGIERTITLDEQFRTHPTLAQFVSDHFYASFDPREAYKSPAGLKKEHGIQDYLGRCLAWHDVQPEGPDDWEQRGQSKSWTTEAILVAKLVRKLIDDPGMKGLSLGVITFYAAQRERIFDDLAHGGEPLVHHVDGQWHIDRDRIKTDKDGELRLRIGTIDAFQGREFDVVILSLGRRNRSEKLRSRFGHVLSANRLCVALSRQKRLLIVTGNTQMIEDRAMDQHEEVRPLRDLLTLARQRACEVMA